MLETIDSTNAEAMRQLEAGAGAGLVCTAEQQSAGRGRRGRTWVSPFARNLYLSVAWRYHQGAAALEGLSLAVGVAVARALAANGLPAVQLKWPNDVIFRGAKLGGVLLEMTGDAAGVCQIVVGVGLNVAMPDSAAVAIDQAWTDIKSISAGTPPGATRCWRRCSTSCSPCWRRLKSTALRRGARNGWRLTRLPMRPWYCTPGHRTWRVSPGAWTSAGRCDWRRPPQACRPSMAARYP